MAAPTTDSNQDPTNPLYHEEISAISHHATENTLSFFRTCINGLNAISGVGILSVPYALASGGWLSLALLFAIAAAAFYSGLLIKKCMDNNSNIETYPDIGEVAFGKIGRLIMSVSMYTELYLVSVGLLILEGDNLNNMFPNEEVQIGGLAIGGKQFFVILVALIILPTVWLDNLSLLSYVSASGVFASIIIILSISWTATFDGVGFHHKGTLVNWNGIPTAVSLYAFCYGAHSVFPTLYNSMTNKHQFSNFALMATPITNALKDLLPVTYKNRVTSILVSTALLISTTIVALTVPFFGSLMSLVGAFLNVTTERKTLNEILEELEKCSNRNRSSLIQIRRSEKSCYWEWICMSSREVIPQPHRKSLIIKLIER
ncbi:hypothetical protein Fmac_017823 [Flemingia macrophylla]|uniref:Amino acid transporter transmembrane domain-containing protein n=1 Tax=Flemingia macrophylla TaxID=520843 RepID=A0ABD1M3P5_9FABA